MKVWEHEYEIMTIRVSIKVEYVLIIIALSNSVFIYQLLLNNK